jgi:RNAse (barnase) inhibitor barstar
VNAKVPTSLDDLPSNAVRSLGVLEPARLQAWAQDARHQFARIDLAGQRDKTGVLRAIGRALAFPEWYGGNLDALYDCLTDLPERRPAPGYVIVLEKLPYTEQFGVEQRDALLDVFRDAAEACADRGVALRVYYTT